MNVFSFAMKGYILNSANKMYFSFLPTAKRYIKIKIFAFFGALTKKYGIYHTGDELRQAETFMPSRQSHQC